MNQNLRLAIQQEQAGEEPNDAGTQEAVRQLEERVRLTSEERAQIQEHALDLQQELLNHVLPSYLCL